MAEDAGRHRQVVEGTEVGIHDVDVQRVLDRTRTSRMSGANGWRLPPGLMWKCTRKGRGIWVAPWSTLREGSIVEYAGSFLRRSPTARQLKWCMDIREEPEIEDSPIIGWICASNLKEATWGRFIHDAAEGETANCQYWQVVEEREPAGSPPRVLVWVNEDINTCEDPVELLA